MLNKYNIVLFKNNKKKKLIKKYTNEKLAIEKFNSLLENNKHVLFEKKVENAENCNFYLSIITDQQSYQKTITITDELGRNKVVDLDDPNFVFIEFKPYKIEELIYDWQTKNKISFYDFIKKYCEGTELKSIFTLHNKVCVQINEDVSVFSLKDKDESERFLSVIEDHFIDNGRSDAFFVRDISTAQRKWVYEILEEKGFDKKHLYRLKTTFSKR